MSLKQIATKFEYNLIREIGNMKIVISKSLNDDIYKIETFRSLPPHDNYQLYKVEFMSKYNMEIFSKKYQMAN